MAGADSTSTAFTWFIHLMSKNPRVQEKIKAELIENNITDRFTLDQIDSLVYLDCVIKEVFRYCPPASGTIRTLITDDILPKSQIPLYKGESVFIPLHNLSRDPRYWSIDPNRFYPERFLDDDQNHHPYALLPFGAGHRQCLGQDLARFQLKVVAARMMQQVTFGDGGPKVNSDEHFIRTTVLPKSVGVTFTFA
jgi:cytochrome P450